jgi:hypothetical protein
LGQMVTLFSKKICYQDTAVRYTSLISIILHLFRACSPELLIDLLCTSTIGESHDD